MEDSKQAGLITIANALTAARLVLLPFIIWGIVTYHGWVAVIGMVAVWITDLLDGRIARRLGQASSFGMTLDSTIDFVLIYSLFITFYVAGRLQTYQFAIIYVGMLLTLILQLWSLAGGKAEVTKTRSGKWAGALQYAYLLFLVAREVIGPSRGIEIADSFLFILLAVAILVSSIGAMIRLRNGLSIVETSGNSNRQP